MQYYYTHSQTSILVAHPDVPAFIIDGVVNTLLQVGVCV